MDDLIILMQFAMMLADILLHRLAQKIICTSLNTQGVGISAESTFVSHSVFLAGKPAVLSSSSPPKN